MSPIPGSHPGNSVLKKGLPKSGKLLPRRQKGGVSLRVDRYMLHSAAHKSNAIKQTAK
jgi:hypothetical protein